MFILINEQVCMMYVIIGLITLMIKHACAVQFLLTAKMKTVMKGKTSAERP